MSAEELEEMEEEKKKDTLFACIQRWLESLPDLAEFPGKFERAIKEMLEKKRSSINKDEKYEENIKKLDKVCNLSYTFYLKFQHHGNLDVLHRKNNGLIHLSRRMNIIKEVGRYNHD